MSDLTNKKITRSFAVEEVSYDPALEEKPVIIDFSKLKYVKKDANFISIPFFSFKKKKSKAINYIYDKEKDIKVEVRAVHDQYVPTAFDHKVLNVLLKYREYYKDKSVFYVSAYQIAKEIYPGMKIGGQNLKRIEESIDRLQTTSYKIYNLYKTRKDNMEYETHEVHPMTILVNASYSDSMLDQDRLYAIKFSDFFINNIENNYYFQIPTEIMDRISNPTEQRFYEIIKYDSYDKSYKKFKPAAVFSYDEVSRKIPLTAEDARNNKKTINKLANELIEKGLIKTFRAHHPENVYFYVEFEGTAKLDAPKLELPQVAYDSMEVEDIPYEENSDQIIDVNLSPLFSDPKNDFIKTVLTEHNQDAYLESVHQLFRESGKDEDYFKSNLLYSLKKSKKEGSLFAYLKKAVDEDWAKEFRIKELQEQKKQEAKAATMQQVLFIQDEELKKEAEEDARYEVLYQTLNEEEQSSLNLIATQKLPASIRAMKPNSKVRQNAIWDCIKVLLLERVGE